MLPRGGRGIDRAFGRVAHGRGAALTPFDLTDLWKPELHPGEVVVRAAIMYLLLQVVFRVAGRKAIERWGLPEVALLFLVTTAVRTSIVGDDDSLTSALVGLVTIVALDRMIAVLTFRSRRLADLIEGPVVQLVRDGAVDRAALSRVRVSEDELLGHARARGRERLDDIKDAFFERSGKVTIVFRE